MRPPPPPQAALSARPSAPLRVCRRRARGRVRSPRATSLSARAVRRTARSSCARRTAPSSSSATTSQEDRTKRHQNDEDFESEVENHNQGSSSSSSSLNVPPIVCEDHPITTLSTSEWVRLSIKMRAASFLRQKEKEMEAVLIQKQKLEESQQRGKSSLASSASPSSSPKNSEKETFQSQAQKYAQQQLAKKQKQQNDHQPKIDEKNLPQIQNDHQGKTKKINKKIRNTCKNTIRRSLNAI